MVEVERDIEEQVLRALRQVARATSMYSHQIQQQFGLTVPQLIVLREAERKGAVTGGDLAAAVSLSQPTVTGIVNRLEKRGLVVRTKSMDDRRMIFISVTEKGKAVLRDAPPSMQARFLEEFRCLQDWEQMMILTALKRVVEMTQAQDLEAATSPEGLDLLGSEEVEAIQEVADGPAAV